MTCRKAIALLADYLDRELTPELLATIDEHLTICAPCRAYFATYERTRELVSVSERIAMPPHIKERLRRLLLGESSGR